MNNLPLNQLIAKGVQRTFIEECTITDECVAFRTTSAADFSADVVIVPLDSMDGKLQIEVNFWFCLPDFERMNFSHMDVTQMLYVRETLSQFLAWSEIRSFPFSEEDTNVALVRHIMTEVSDIESMSEQDEQSSFFIEVTNVAIEAGRLYAALFAVASSQITDPAALPPFISDGDESRN